MVIRWENVDVLEDYFITYLLYLDSLTIPQISRVRNKTIEEVNDDLIKAKLAVRDSKKSSKSEKKDEILEFLTKTKEDRLEYIGGLSDEELESFKAKVYKSILKVNNADDLIVLVWTAGEFKDKRFLKILYPLTERPHTNIRRITYSAIGKIGEDESVIYLEMGLMDNNPQVRMYCAKFLGTMGRMESIRILENLVKNKSDFEKGYVINTCKESLVKLYSKFNISI